MSEEFFLRKLINDESFIRWLKDNIDPKEKEDWDRWLMKSLEHRCLANRAVKILSMPFKISKIEDDDLLEQLGQLQKTISKENKNDAAEKENE